MPHAEPDSRTAPASFNVGAHAARAAESAARRAGAVTDEESRMAGLIEVSRLLESVWGRSAEGVPVNSEVLRSLVHAGGCVTVARDADATLIGAAVLAPAAASGTTYSIIAAVAPGTSDRGVGQALKLRQRSWALARGFHTMTWTFDPLVGRNARFNLAKLGAVSTEYEPAFYGRMSDELNGVDDSDRLVATWRLGTGRTIAATEGTAADPSGPGPGADLVTDGPDGLPMLVRDARGTWCRVPADVVELRRRLPEEASKWRLAVREALTGALARGLAAVHVTRDGWYLLSADEEIR